MRVFTLSILAAMALILCAVMPAFADLGAYNKAVTAGDYKTAATEAASTWPTLDRTKPDIGIIAREFGYAAYMGRDYAGMHTYAQVAADPATPGNTDLVALATARVLLRLSEHRLAPTPGTRDGLAKSLSDRLAHPGVENISLAGVDALAAYDSESGNWKALRDSAQLAANLADRGGQALTVLKRRFELYSSIAEFFDAKAPRVYERFMALRAGIASDMDAAATDEIAATYVPLHWETRAWQGLVRTYFDSSGKKLPIDLRKADREEPAYSPRVRRLTHYRGVDAPCTPRLKIGTQVKYPKTALYGGYVGSVYALVDISSEGKAYNLRILAAIPDKPFGEAVLEAVPYLSFEPGSKNWDKKVCQLEQKDSVIHFVYEM